MDQVPRGIETERQRSANSDCKIRKIVVAIDLSPRSENTAAFAAAFAKRVGASMTVVHVFPPEPITEFTGVQAHEAFEEGRRRTVGKLGKLIDKVRETGVDCSDDFRVGDPAEEVVMAAQSLKADLIITASHHPGLLGRALGWDQAPRILHRATCPVLVYHGIAQ